MARAYFDLVPAGALASRFLTNSRESKHFVEYYPMTDLAVCRQYDRLAKSYDQRWRRYITQTLMFLKSWTSISPQAGVLDVGCGTGEFERLVLREHPEQRMVGVDVSGKMLELARQKCQAYPNVTFCTASASALPFPDHRFDVVVSASALHYFDQPEASLVEMRRVVKPGGVVVILDWCKDYLLCQLFDIVLKLIEPAYHGCYTQRELQRFLASAQFDIQSTRRVRFGLVWGLMTATAVAGSGS
jgi:ubiquinone/menaquinone biosynthesis C-methylase UbiE